MNNYDKLIPVLWEQKVAGSNPAAPTSEFKGLRIVRRPPVVNGEDLVGRLLLPVDVSLRRQDPIRQPGGLEEFQRPGGHVPE